jgi:hypothetical protein
MLHGIGFFITSLRDTDFPAPQELVVDDSRLSAVADYLDQGLIHERYRGFSWCRVCGPDFELMGSTDLTDGVWLWPAGLSHYLRSHSVGLPEMFITHALAKPAFTQPPSDAVTDCSLWIEWARPQRSQTLRKAIAQAQLEDDRLAAIARAERVTANREKFGESEAACIYAGCKERALNGMVLCGNHLPEMSIDDAFHSQAHRLLREALQTTIQ